MSFYVFHQAGHNATWSVDSLERDHTAQGIIFSPVHQSADSVKRLKTKIRECSLFDPQFYLPNSQKNKFKQYSFFPETATDGFSTIDYSAVADHAATECVKFQIEQNFAAIVIPTRYLDQMYPDYRERQDAFTVAPFVKAINSSGSNKSVFLTLAITPHMIEAGAFRTQLLNWITSYPEITGVYLITTLDRPTKQIQSDAFLVEKMTFIQELQSSGMNVVLGYLNTESLLMTVFNNATLTIGTFDNTRIFSIDKFVANDEDKRGPRPRIYLNGLMNWVRFDQAKAIRDALPKVWAEIYEETDYGNAALTAPTDPHFSQPTLYKHHHVAISRQFDALKGVTASDRVELLNEWLDSASAAYRSISKAGIELDLHGAGTHITPWSKALNRFAKLGGLIS